MTSITLTDSCVSDQEPRKMHGAKQPGMPNGGAVSEDQTDGGGGEEHGDHTLERTGRWGGG